MDKGRHVAHPKLYNGLFGTASVIWREEGIRGMYRGLGPIVLGYLPTWAVWFTVYNKSKVWMGQYSGKCLLRASGCEAEILTGFFRKPARDQLLVIHRCRW